MIKLDEAILNEMVESIVRAVDPTRVVLFGSAAREGGRIDSDIDLVIIEGQPLDAQRSRRQEILKVRRSLSRFHIAKDILIYSEEEVLEWQDSPGHILTTALREGKTLYARS